MTRTLLFVVNVDWFFLSHRLPIALEAKRRGYSVHIATGLTDKLEELQQYGFAVHPISLDRSSASLRLAWRTGFEIWRVFRVVQPDVVHLVTIKPVLLGGLAARLAGVPAVVFAVSGLGLVFVAKGALATIRRLAVGCLYKLAFGHRNLKVVFQNTDDRDCLARIVRLSESAIEVIRGSGVDLAEYHMTPIPSGNPVVVFAARLLVEKGVREFVESARLLKRRGSCARFCIVGSVDPSNPSSLTEAELAKWEREGVVEVWGHRSDMPQVLAVAHIVVLPSYYGEGLPKVLVEAAACGRAVVTTDHPGCRDAIEPGETGLLIPVRDSAGLAEAIDSLIENPARCQAMGAAGRALAERAFDVKQVVAEHMRIYEELMGKR